jgi:tetratricopeptide (TPR) repeat protein
MPDTNPQQTLDTHASELQLSRFESAWIVWRGGDPMPDWRQHLPADDEPCNSTLIFDLLQIDIEYRIRAGKPALLAERYFEHPRLQHEDARLEDARQVELIQGEYLERLRNGDQPRRAEYEAVFPHHLEALREMKPRSRCPRCHKILVLQETFQSLLCPDCGCESSLLAAAPPFVADTTSQVALDFRGYQLIETLGKGGMGEVFRCCDPALGRDLAIKVMKTSLRGDPEVERRLFREARVTGSLQHPGIVPVHNLGRLADGRLHYTMRLVRGQTFADILKDEAGKPERLPYLLTIFEKICQAVAYAHSKRVIHRDLKPHNVMVGRFGEVQVMDWGLAKVLTPEEPAVTPEETLDATGTRIFTESAELPVDLTRTGSGMGTLSYMPPEQARGKWGKVDERADVFALGSILCEMLTGQPAYIGTSNELLDRVERGDVAEALERLEQCGADAPLSALCRECLSPRREDRPRDAEAVAKRVAEYREEVQERLRHAELERVAAETRAREEQARALVEQERTREALARAKAERRAKRNLLFLTAAAFVLLVGGGGSAWWMQQVRAASQARQNQADREALAGLERAREHLEKGWGSHDLKKLEDARTEAERAAAISQNAGASDSVEQQVAEFQEDVQKRLERAKKNETLLRDFLDIAMPHETKTYKADESGLMMVLAEPSMEEQYAASFRRRWPDIDVDRQEASTVAMRLKEEPAGVVEEVIAGLDGWMMERRRQRSSQADWRRLLGVVQLVDHTEQRQKLRTLLIGAEPPSAVSVAGLLAGSPPWPVLWELGRGNTWRRLRQLRAEMTAATEPVLTVMLLARTSSEVGDMAGAEEVLRQALARLPNQVALLDALGKVQERQGRLAEAIGCYRAARAMHPALGIALGNALTRAGRAAEGEAVLRDLVRQQPGNPEMLIQLGYVLTEQGKHGEAEEACRKAIALNSDNASAYVILGIALNKQGRPAEGEAACRRAIALDPGFARAYGNLSVSLNEQKKFAESEQACRKALALQPDQAWPYNDLGSALALQGKFAEAEAALRKAIALQSDFAWAYMNLGMALGEQTKYAEAEAAFRKTIDLKPDFAEAYCNLGSALNDQGKFTEAEAACRKAIALKPDFAHAYNNLGAALNEQERSAEAETACRKAIALNPLNPHAHANLGKALTRQGKAVEAEAFCRKAIALKPDFGYAYRNLGYSLLEQGKLAEAEDPCRKAIALNPKDVAAYIDLSIALGNQGKFAEAEIYCRKAITVNPDFADAYHNLGAALNGQGKFKEAEEAYRKALSLKPDLALAHIGLGFALRVEGRFAESLAAFRHGHELGSKQPRWHSPSAQWVHSAEHMVELEKQLPAILRGEASPANAEDANILGWMCQQPYQKRYAASARLYAAAFTGDPTFAADLNAQHRYNAACSAALASARQGKDARSLPDRVVAMFRRWALDWLRDDLKSYTQLAERNNPDVNKMIQQRLAHCRRDPDLASVREPESLERLPDDERAAWQTLWRDVAELAKRAAKTDETNAVQKKSGP